MSSSPSLRPLYNFTGWVIKNIKLSSDVTVIKIRYDKRHLHKCPFCGQKMKSGNLGSGLAMPLFYFVRPRWRYGRSAD